MNTNSLKTISYITLIIGSIIFIFFNDEYTSANFIVNILIAGLYTFAFVVTNGWTNDFLSKRFSWVNETKRRVLYGIIATVTVNVLVTLLCNYINFILIWNNDPSKFFTGNMAVTNWFTLNIALLISAVLHARSFMEEWKKSTRKEVVEQKLIAKSASAQFETLKNQLDPHFLFNSLNVLSSLIDENPHQAQRFTASMSKIYRYVLEQKDKEMVEVQEELDFANIYCGLLKTRFEDSVVYSFDVDAADYSHFVVPLSLQLLLENCIKHNFATPSKPLRIRIFSADGNLIVENNLQAREQTKESAGIGLANIVQRYSLITKKNVHIEKSNDFFRVKIPILTTKSAVMKTPASYESAAYERAVKRVKELKGFYGNLISYCVFIPFLIFINLRTSDFHWFWFPLLGWGIGVVSNGMQVFVTGVDWEERQIRKILEKEHENERRRL